MVPFDTFRGRSVLVTGHSGFKGGWLCTWLLQLGAHVTGISLSPWETPNLFEALGLAELLSSTIVDIRGAAVRRSFDARTLLMRKILAEHPENYPVACLKPEMMLFQPAETIINLHRVILAAER